MGQANYKSMLHLTKDIEKLIRYSCKTSCLDLFIHYI